MLVTIGDDTIDTPETDDIVNTDDFSAETLYDDVD
jgi:hypothetical protein